jgi:hypothetical protein
MSLTSFVLLSVLPVLTMAKDIFFIALLIKKYFNFFHDIISKIIIALAVSIFFMISLVKLLSL